VKTESDWAEVETAESPRPGGGMHTSSERIEVYGRAFKQFTHLRGSVKTIDPAPKNVSLMESLEEG